MYSKNILLTGYWPPTNQMLYKFNPRRAAFTVDYVGRNYLESGYNVVGFFPQFDDDETEFFCKPDGTYPVGRGTLKVDYQSTLNDFNYLVNKYKPCAIITFSRFFDTKLIQIEPGHGVWDEWKPDINMPFDPNIRFIIGGGSGPLADFGPFFFNYISGLGTPMEDSYRSTLPMDAIEASFRNNTPEQFIDFTQILRPTSLFRDGDNFLSNYIGALGTKYESEHNYLDPNFQCVTAGHIHVGGGIDLQSCEVLVDKVLHEVFTVLDTTLQPIWLGGIGIELRTDEAMFSDTGDLITLELIRDDIPLASVVLDAGGHDDFRTPGESFFYGGIVYGIIPDESDGASSADRPPAGIEFSNGLMDHLKLKLSISGEDLWVGDRTNIFIKEFKDVGVVGGVRQWRLDNEWLNIKNISRDIRLSQQGHEAPSDEHTIDFNVI